MNAFQRGDDRQHADGRDGRAGERKQHPPEEAERATAVHPRRILELHRDTPEERAKDHDGEWQAEGGLRERHPQQAARQPDLADEDIQRQDRDGGREEQPEHEQGVHRLAASEPDPGEHERRRGCAADGDPDRDDRDDDAVQELAPEGGGVLAPQDIGIVLEDPRVREERHRIPVQLAVVLEATEDCVDDRHEDRGRNRQQDHEGDGPGDGPARTLGARHGQDSGRLSAQVGGCPGRHRLIRCRPSRRRRCRDAGRIAGTAGPPRGHTGRAARRTHCRTPSAASRNRS